LADAEPGGIVVHCLAGKDRTGLVTALALRLAGVSRESIADDYAASEQAWGPRHEEWVAEAGDDVDREARRRQGLAPGDAMVDVLRDLAGLERVVRLRRHEGPTDRATPLG